MKLANRTPPSRLGRKQVIAFLRPNQIDAVAAKAAAENKTHQEVLGEALNAVFAMYGMPRLIPEGHGRVVRRSRGKARARDEFTGAPSCRVGRKSLSGWFDADIVNRLLKFSSEINIPVQGIVEKGVKELTGVAPDDGEELDSWAAE